MFQVKKGKAKFYIGDSEENTRAEISYVYSGENILIIDHTQVADDLSGQGVGKLLIKEVVKYAEKENKKVIPLCPYAKAQMEKNPDYRKFIYS